MFRFATCRGSVLLHLHNKKYSFVTASGQVTQVGEGPLTSHTEHESRIHTHVHTCIKKSQTFSCFVGSCVVLGITEQLGNQ